MRIIERIKSFLGILDLEYGGEEYEALWQKLTELDPRWKEIRPKYYGLFSKTSLKRWINQRTFKEYQ